MWKPNSRIGLLWLAAAGPLFSGCASAGGRGASGAAELTRLAQAVEVRRTTHGVPHILADNLRAAAFGLAYVQIEDHGVRVIEGINAARGRTALLDGPRRVAADARALQRHARAAEKFGDLKRDTRDVYDGFAQGMNHYIVTHRAEVPAWMQPDYTGVDVLAAEIAWPSDATMNSFRQRLTADPDAREFEIDDEAEGEAEQSPDNVGSNAWALGPSRTTSGKAILLRNPHLAWTAGYYEGHVRVPGKLDFYGDFRIGGPFSVIGGFNRDLGFATTNNQTRSHEFYALRADSTRPDHIIFDGRSRPLRRETVTVEYRDSTGGIAKGVQEYWTSDLGPVVHRANGMVYVLKSAANGEYRAGEQWLEMMKAKSLDEYRAAMRIQARATSHFTYADRAGNIFYVSVSTAPALPHEPGGDSIAIPATRREEIWTRLVPFDSLPQLLNPPGGYIQNENSSPHFTNLNRILPDTFPFWVEEPSLSLRSQHALEILHNDRKFSLEDVVAAKHSMKMLLADRVKDDLVAAVRAASPQGEVQQAIDFLAAWDNTVAAASRGGLLFETWWNRYRTLTRGEDAHAVEWTTADPARTPHGLADPVKAAEAFAWAVPETARRFGSWNAAWGDVHRVRRGDVDVPVGGCGGALGCFRVLNFTTAEDGKRIANGGDGWVIAVEFGDEPRAYSVLAYGQSPDPASPYHADQAAMFAGNRMKPVQWTEADIASTIVERYHPGQERRR